MGEAVAGLGDVMDYVYIESLIAAATPVLAIAASAK